MKMALAAVEKLVYFGAEAKDIKDAVEEIDLADVAKVDLVVHIEEEENIGAVDKMIVWCNEMMDQNWWFIYHMTSRTMNCISYLRQKE